MVVVECTLIVAPGGDSLLDVLQAMDGFGYAVFDVLGGGYRPLDGALGQLDVVFLPKAHRLRRDLRWSAS